MGTPKDLETFKLSDKGSYLSYTFPREIGAANADNALQHQSNDSIIAIFRNPDLPLDTLRIAIPFGLGTQNLSQDQLGTKSINHIQFLENKAHFNIKNAKNATIQITNLKGKQLLKKDINRNTVVSLGKFSSGPYIAQIKIGAKSFQKTVIVNY